MKKIVSVLLFVLLLSGCKSRKKPIVVQRVKPHAYASSVKGLDSIESQQEDLDGFILLDDVDEQSNSDGMATGSYKDVFLDEDDISLVDDRDEDRFGFKTAYFDFDRYSIRTDQVPVFEQNLQAIRKALKEGKKIVIEGHADTAAGSRAYNLQLSQRRAQTAADWYVDHGVPVTSLKVIGRGSEMLIVPAGDKNAQAPNRRVQIYTISA